MADSSTGAATASGEQQQEHQQLPLRLFPTSPADPFDCLPIKMPHRSMELFRHLTNYRIFSRTAVQKNPNSETVGLALNNPGVFRGSLLMAALHNSWLSYSNSGSPLHNSDMQQTYIYHKLEAMRQINVQIADPVMCTSDECIGLIAALAMAESGMGDCEAAEAHLKGLFALINMKRPEEWQHLFWGILQRIILITGSFIAAAKNSQPADIQQSPVESRSVETHHHSRGDYIRPTGPLFSTAPFTATRLSPFYMGSTPSLEACKADAEGEVLVNALRRLSSQPQAWLGRDTSKEQTNTPNPARDNTTAILLSDTDAFIVSLLFKPHPLHTATRSQGESGLYTTMAMSPSQPAGGSPTSSSSSSSPSQSPSPHPSATHFGSRNHSPSSSPRPQHRPQPRFDPYDHLPADLFPSTSRAWATAAYLYLHIILQPLWGSSNEVEVEPYLLRLLLDTLRDDIEHTEKAMMIGAYSSELWLWKVVVGAYTLSKVEGGEMGVHVSGEEGERKTKRRGTERRGRRGKDTLDQTEMVMGRRMGRRRGGYAVDRVGGVGESGSGLGLGVVPMGRDTGEGDGEGRLWSSGSESGESGLGSGASSTRDFSEGYVDEGEGVMDEGDEMENDTAEYVVEMKAWLDARLRVWKTAARVSDWQSARRLLSRIAWPEHNSLRGVDSIVQEIWWNAVGDAPDPGLW
ncbi:hypothetical protein B0T17DRAFT_617530 [Bombardia bombarda]|uniref:Uncharacterized protein n=1 Tax=Bombardia bombarda TaxID=252184 RepID=A0AA39X261_9PEZI|nr:hypothetical protein B0T17DRAFT_617530 [Bombardia bombarda]